ncbi:MAG: ribose-phosphate pyrophosphokinase [Erysipelotrichaceae bacterium]
MTETIVFALSSSVNLAHEICEHLKLEPGKISVKHFADGEILIEPEETVRGKKVYIIQSTCGPVSENLMEVLICIDACKRASAGEITVVTPYFGYARQDRKARARQPITAKLVADLLQVAGAGRVVTIDLHASQIQGFFNIPIDDLTVTPMLGHYFKSCNFDFNNVVVVSPDHGGTTRARKLADILHVPIAIIDKRRPKPNVAEAMNVIGDIEGKVCIVIDDICDTAGSLVAGCKILEKYGAKEIYAAISHGLFSGEAIDRINNSPIKKMVVTNTIELSEDKKASTDKLEVLSVGWMLSNIISAINTHSPVSDVYNLFDIE